ncbi:hypothetical protein E2K98_04930 [Bacillus salipaludis]|uniref:Electron transfer flavoprotein alpha/beta-subunit N-terminal domain-containing protein n=1 Tax=Bacillus salipaludis TaxID=2547811 RepID=A0A4R5VYT4_9BACI|nr:hypothetical protein [Bacillus salipaludis]MDQ6594913.1 hypothetical protein [Bacillus salipaludis]TDK64206.1 hypothetical protein E2K98_04930 [Bacillus salipaludis]
MLNFVVLVRSVFDSISIKWDYQNQKLKYLSDNFNKQDLHALQWACNYKEKQPAHITVLLMVEEGREVSLHRIKKFPIDVCKVVHVPEGDQHSTDMAPYIYEELKESHYDVILCGSESEDMQRGTTPILLARYLNIPYISRVYSIDSELGDDTWGVQCKEGRSTLHTFTIKLPALIGVERSVTPLRYISRIHGNKSVEIITKRAGPIQSATVKNKRIKISEKQPVIRYLEVPTDFLAQHRMLSVAGITKNQNEKSSAKTKSVPTPEHIHFIARKVEQWLKE